jgi:hypothetical protein
VNCPRCDSVNVVVDSEGPWACCHDCLCEFEVLAEDVKEVGVSAVPVEVKVNPRPALSIGQHQAFPGGRW